MNLLKTNKHFIKKKDLKTNHKGVLIAEGLRSNREEDMVLQEKCSRLYVQNVEKKLQCLLSLVMISLYIVKSAFKQKEIIKI